MSSSGLDYSLDVIKNAISKVLWFSRFVRHRSASEKTMQELNERATAIDQVEHRWVDGAPISEAKNAHYTNTKDELTAGLSKDYNFLEGDVWLEGALRRLPLVERFREPIMAHYPNDVKGLTVEEWLKVGLASGKGLKLDIKQSAALPETIQEAKDLGVPGSRLIFNADMAFGPGVKKDLKFRLLDATTDFLTQPEEMMEARKAFPDATIGVGLYTQAQSQPTKYSQQQLQQVIQIARELGGPITFPLRAEFVDKRVVETLKPHGTVSIWNHPKSFLPDDFERATREFREMGVDGMIDLRDFERPEKDWKAPAPEPGEPQHWYDKALESQPRGSRWPSS